MRWQYATFMRLPYVQPITSPRGGVYGSLTGGASSTEAPFGKDFGDPRV